MTRPLSAEKVIEAAKVWRALHDLEIVEYVDKRSPYIWNAGDTGLAQSVDAYLAKSAPSVERMERRKGERR